MASFPPVLIMVVAAVLVALSPHEHRPEGHRGRRPAARPRLSWYGASRQATPVTLTWLFLRTRAVACQTSPEHRVRVRVRDRRGARRHLRLAPRGPLPAGCCALGYAGTSIGVVFAGDLLTLVLFWELMALTSAYLVWAGGYPGSRAAGTRYLFVHMVGGSTLLAGVLWHLGTGGSLDFSLFEGSVAGWLVLGGFAINAAIVPLHAWLTDAYPEAGVTGSVFLSAFTTKTAVYVLARGFAGWEILIFLGVIMALYGVVFAVLENDIRRLLAYHIISQVGYMVAGVGIGTEIAINGAVCPRVRPRHLQGTAVHGRRRRGLCNWPAYAHRPRRHIRPHAAGRRAVHGRRVRHLCVPAVQRLRLQVACRPTLPRRSTSTGR